MSEFENDTNKMCDKELDRCLSCFDVPDMDEKGFDARLMAAICKTLRGQEISHDHSDNKVFFWTKPVRFAAVAFLAFLSVILASNADFLAISSQNPHKDVIASLTTPIAGQERFEVASTTVIQDTLPDREAFYTEMADQDILLMDYEPVAPDSIMDEPGADLPPIDQFLDDLLGMESRSL